MMITDGAPDLLIESRNKIFLNNVNKKSRS